MRERAVGAVDGFEICSFVLRVGADEADVRVSSLKVRHASAGCDRAVSTKLVTTVVASCAVINLVNLTSLRLRIDGSGESAGSVREIGPASGVASITAVQKSWYVGRMLGANHA